jgi:hypothetical protein
MDALFGVVTPRICPFFSLAASISWHSDPDFAKLEAQSGGAGDLTILDGGDIKGVLSSLAKRHLLPFVSVARDSCDRVNMVRSANCF